MKLKRHAMGNKHGDASHDGPQRPGLWRLSLGAALFILLAAAAASLSDRAFGISGSEFTGHAIIAAGLMMALLGLWFSSSSYINFRGGRRACDAASAGLTICLGALAGIAWSTTPYASLLDVIAQTFGAIMGVLIAGLLFAAPYRASGTRDVVELLTNRFHSGSLRLLTLLICTIGLCAIAAGALAGAGMMAAAAQPEWSFGIGLGVSATLAATAVLRGGIGSETSVARAAGAAVLLAFLFSPLLLSIAPEGHILGVLSSMARVMSDNPFTSGAETVWRALALGASTMIGVAVAPQLLARTGVTHSLDAARGSTIWAAGFLLLIAAVAPFYALLAHAQQNQPLVYQHQLFVFDTAHWATAAFGIAAYAALLAIAASAALSASTLLTAEVNRRIPLSGLLPGTRLMAARATLLLVMGLAAILAPPTALEGAHWITFGLTLIGAALFTPILMAFWWRRSTGWGASVAMATGATAAGTLMAGGSLPTPVLDLAQIGFGWRDLLGPNYLPNGHWSPSIIEAAAGVVGTFAGLIAGVVATFASMPPTPAEIEHFEAISGPIGDPPLGRSNDAD